MNALSRRCVLAGCLCASSSWALGRRAYGGTLRLVLPWKVRRLDPQELSDPASALFAAAMSDALFALDSQGRPYPTLAEDLPEARDGGVVRVTLRKGLRTARGAALDARDLLATLTRLQQRPGRAVLFGVDRFQRVPKAPLSVDFFGLDAVELARRLASPLCALLPRGFSPLEPDATGAFRAELGNTRLRLTRNPHAARGAAFLDGIEVDAARELAECLRAFEAGSADVGWLGSGLYRARAGAVAFSGVHYGWAVLRTGQEARTWSAPGVAQQLVDGIAPERLKHLGLEGLPANASASAGWSFGPAEICVADDAPQLAWIADSLAAALSRPGHELRVLPLPQPELSTRRQNGKYKLMLDFVRALGPPGPLTALALFAAHDPETARSLPNLRQFDARELARRLPFGVVGELWAAGAHRSDFQAVAGWQLGDIWKKP